MSIRQFGHKNGAESDSELIATYPAKASTSIDITSKLQVIQALDNGICKADLAKEYGLPPQAITDIYKQKNSIIKKYIHEYNLLNHIYKLNLEQHLINWFEQQLAAGSSVTEEQLKTKSLDLLKSVNEDFTCIDDWLLSFCMRNNISKCTEDGSTDEAKDEWKKFLKGLNSRDVYLGGVCALAYNLEVSSYLNREDTDNYVSVLFTSNVLGTDRRELVVVGAESLESDTCVKSLSVTYYCSVNSQINYSVINSYLTKWNEELSSKDKTVTLILNTPDSWISNNFDHIKVISTTDLIYAMQILNEIEDCFKYKYRKLQISRGATYGKDNCTYLDQLHMIGNAWYSVSYKFIQSISIPAEEGRLYFNIKNDFSISQWVKTYNVQLNTEYCPKVLDKYISIDKEFPCLYTGKLDDSKPAVDVLSSREPESTSGMEAYQAMKRLVSYMQCEGAGENENGESVMKYAKYLENHVEYGALLQIHQIIARNNDSN